MIFPLGPLYNALFIVAGGLIGLALGSRMPERVRTIVFQGLGLCTLAIGLKMAFTTVNPVIMIFSVLIGSVIGELFRLEECFTHIGDWCKAHIKSNNPRFTEGLVSASVLFCIGAMAIVGSFDEGLRGDRTVVLSKSVLDCFAGMALASAYGTGVLFSSVSVFIYQGILTVCAGMLQPWLTPPIMTELVAVGGVLIMGISMNLLNILKIRLSNMLPALAIVVILASIFC